MCNILGKKGSECSSSNNKQMNINTYYALFRRETTCNKDVDFEIYLNLLIMPFTPDFPADETVQNWNKNKCIMKV